MYTKVLSDLSLISKALSHNFRSQLMGYIKHLYPKMSKHFIEQHLNIYASFLFSQDKHNFNATEITDNKSIFQNHINQLIGFIYHESDKITISSKSNFARILAYSLYELAKENYIDIPHQSFGNKKIKDYKQRCIESYQSLERNEEKLSYLNGWRVKSQEHKEFLVNLDFLYVKYGQSFTDKIHNALKQYALTQKSTTLSNKIFRIIQLLEVTSSLDTNATVETFELLLSKKNVQTTFYKAYQYLFSDCVVKGNDFANFSKSFIHSLNIYKKIFINTNIYPAPLKPFIKPEILKVQNPPSFSSGGEPSEEEKMRWFANIPLHIKDEQAIEIIESRINRDMNILRTTFTEHFKQLKQRQERNKVFIENGIVKPLEGNVSSKGYAIGEHNLDSTIATFYHYGINGYRSSIYERFLGFHGKTEKLIEELNLPTYASLFSLTALLVMEHPKITPSWLQKLQLYNENGKLTGYIQVGEQYILTSEKERRGRNLAQQDVILNEFSKSIVDFIVQHTEIARKYLKAIGNPNWKFLLLTCSLHKAEKPSFASLLYKPTPIVRKLFNYKLVQPFENYVSQQELDIIINLTTHRSIRRHRVIQIYLETRSQTAVADALGHKVVDSKLLDSYLPKPLMEYFTDRVIRQFQKAIIFEAMKESPYLLDATNMTYKELEEFLENHGLRNIPKLNAATFDKASSRVECSIFDSVIFTITVPLLQLLISIKTIIDDDDDATIFNASVQHWYQSASYLFKCIEENKVDNDDILDMYQEAKAASLDLVTIKGLISC